MVNCRLSSCTSCLVQWACHKLIYHEPIGSWAAQNQESYDHFMILHFRVWVTCTQNPKCKINDGDLRCFKLLLIICSETSDSFEICLRNYDWEEFSWVARILIWEAHFPMTSKLDVIGKCAKQFATANLYSYRVYQYIIFSGQIHILKYMYNESMRV